jgi:hypothetical protein
MEEDEHENETFEESTPMEQTYDTFEEQNPNSGSGEEEFEEDEDIPMVSGKANI